MELELINHIRIKLRIIEMYEECPQTEAKYLRTRESLKKQQEKLKQKYKETADRDILIDLEEIEFKLSYNVSPLSYKSAKEDVEIHKANYIEEIPEKYWNYPSFSKIYLLLKNGGLKSLQAALNYIDTY